MIFGASNLLLKKSGLNIPAGYTSLYTVDSVSGSDFIDLEGSYDGTITGAAVISDYEGSISFDGADDYVVIPNVGDTLGTDFTVCAIFEYVSAAVADYWFAFDDSTATTLTALGVSYGAGGTNYRLVGTTTGGTFTTFDSGEPIPSSGQLRSTILSQDSVNGKRVDLDGALYLSSINTEVRDVQDFYMASNVFVSEFVSIKLKYLIFYPFVLDSSERALIDALAD